MIRAAFLSLPAQGHVNPTLPLVAELVRRGHAVRYFGTEEFRAPIDASGAVFEPYPNLGYDLSRPDRNILELAAALAEVTVAILPAVVDAVRATGAELVLHDSMAAWGRHAARLLGLPAVCSTSTFAIAPMMDRSLRGLADVVATTLGGLGAARRLRCAREALRARHGIDGLRFPDVLSNRGDLTLVYTSRRLQPQAERFDDSVCFVGPSLAAEPERDPLLAELDGACAGGAPLIYVSLGTVFNDDPGFFRACAEAFAGTEIQVLVSAGRKVRLEELGPIPPNVRVRPFVPQLAVLRRTSLFVTHAGMNSVNEGLSFGVPLLLFPQMTEQAFVARRVEALGAGRVLPRSALSPRALRAAALGLLHDGGARERARWIGESLREAGGPTRAADLVEALARPARMGGDAVRG